MSGGKRLVDKLREPGFGVTHVDAHGASGPVLIVYTIVMRKRLERVDDIIESIIPSSFFTVEELRSVQDGIFAAQPVVHHQISFGRKPK